MEKKAIKKTKGGAGAPLSKKVEKGAKLGTKIIKEASRLRKDGDS